MPDFGRFKGKEFDTREGPPKQELIGKINDIKPAPQGGMRRVEVQERTGRREIVAIDIPMREAEALERKKAYKFLIDEKERPSYEGQPMKKPMGYRAYDCFEEPEEHKSMSPRREPKRSDGRSGSTTSLKNKQ